MVNSSEEADYEDLIAAKTGTSVIWEDISSSHQPSCVLIKLMDYWTGRNLPSCFTNARGTL